MFSWGGRERRRVLRVGLLRGGVGLGLGLALRRLGFWGFFHLFFGALRGKGEGERGGQEEENEEEGGGKKEEKER